MQSHAMVTATLIVWEIVFANVILTGLEGDLSRATTTANVFRRVIALNSLEGHAVISDVMRFALHSAAEVGAVAIACARKMNVQSMATVHPKQKHGCFTPTSPVLAKPSWLKALAKMTESGTSWQRCRACHCSLLAWVWRS